MSLDDLFADIVDESLPRNLGPVSLIELIKQSMKWQLTL
jgi:hypothetical protein